MHYPLNGVKTHEILGELIRAYGWDVLAAQIPIRCFKSYPSFDSSLKYLLKTEWARQRLEAFYIYKFKQLPRPSNEQHALPPRDRTFTEEQLNATTEEGKVVLGDPEFFDDPVSGPVFPSKKAVKNSQMSAKQVKTKLAAGEVVKEVSRRSKTRSPEDVPSKTSTPDTDDGGSDPWSRWR